MKIAGEVSSSHATGLQLGVRRGFSRGERLWLQGGAFSDLKPVKKFTDRKSAVARIWQAVQKLAPATAGTDAAQQGAQDAPGVTGSTKAATANPSHPRRIHLATEPKAKVVLRRLSFRSLRRRPPPRR